MVLETIAGQPRIFDTRNTRAIWLEYADPTVNTIEIYRGNRRTIVLTPEDAEILANNILKRVQELKDGNSRKLG
jgi:hypothetical protein